MFRRSAILILCLLLMTFYACGRASHEGAQTQNSQPAAPPPAAPPPVNQAQQPELPSKPEVEPARAEPAQQAPRRPAAKPAPAAQTPAPASNAGEAARPPASVPAAAKQAVEPVSSAALPAQPVPPPPPPPPPKPIVIPAETRFEVRLIDPIGSNENKTGDTFRATLEQNLEVDGKVVIPRGSIVKGRLVEVKQPGRVEGRAAMTIALMEIMVDKTAHAIQTNTLAFEAEKSTKEDATRIGIGAGVGAIIGAIAGGGKGAAIGAAVGGGAGTATVLATKGKDVKFSSEDRFSFVLRSDLVIKQ